MGESSKTSSAFIKTLGPMGVVLLTFSALSPALSVFVGGSGLLHMAGTGAAIAFIGGGLIAAVTALLYAEMGAAFPRAGGLYPTVAGALGPGFAFPLLILATLTAPAVLAFFALGFAEYAHFLVPDLPQLPLALAGIALTAAIALLRIRIGALITGIFLAVEMAAIVLLAVVAAMHPVRGLGEVLAHPVMLVGGALASTPPEVLALAVVSGTWTTAGASWAMYFAEEMQGARRGIGRLIAWIGFLAAAMIAAPVVLMLMSVKDVAGMLAAPAPIAFYMEQTGGRGVANLVSWGVVLASFNALIAVVLAVSRMLYATGRDQVWPAPVNRVLGTLHPRLNTPVAATLMVAALSMAGCFLGQRTLQILLAGDVFSIFLLSAAVLVGRRRGRTGMDYGSPFFPLTPIMVIASGVVFSWATYLDEEAGRPSLIITTSLFVAALAYDAWRRRSGRHWRMQDLEDEAS
jgi:hypothetical protein